MQPYLLHTFTNARRLGINGEEAVGLGMSSVKAILELHKGKRWFTSEERQYILH